MALSLSPIMQYQGSALDLMGNYNRGQEMGMLKQQNQMKLDAMARELQDKQALRGVLGGLAGQQNPDYTAAALQAMQYDPETATALLNIPKNQQQMALLKAQISGAGLNNQNQSLVNRQLQQKMQEDQAIHEGMAAGNLYSNLEKVAEEKRPSLWTQTMKSLESQGIEIPPDMKGYTPENMNRLPQLHQGAMDIVTARSAADPTADMQNFMFGQQNPDFTTKQDGFSLSPGETRYDASGNPIVTAPQPPLIGAGDGSGATGEDYLSTLDTATANMVKGIAEGRISPPSPRSKNGLAILSAVSQYDPTFDAVNYQARQKGRIEVTSGATGKNITSLNTVLGHLKSLQESGAALNNAGIPLWNIAANYAAQQTGDPRITAFNTNKKAVADELTRVFAGSGGALEDRKQWENKISAASSPEQQKAFLQETAKLLESRISAVGDQYNNAMGTTKDGLELLHPKQRAFFNELIGNEVDPLAANQAAADAVDRSTGGQLPRTDEDKAHGVVQVASPEEAAALPSGTKFMTHDGRVMVKK